MTDKDLFQYAAELRDLGMTRAEEAAGPMFSALAFAAIRRVAQQQATVHVDDVLRECSVRPSSPNAWGAVWMKAIKSGLICRTGEARRCRTDPNKHAHTYPVYKSMIYRASPASGKSTRRLYRRPKETGNVNLRLFD